MPKVVISDAVNPGAADILRQAGFTVVFNDAMSAEELTREMADAEALIVRSKTKADAVLIAASPKLKVIGRAGAGVDNIDLTAASAAGVIVMNTPGANSIAAAEHAMALMLALARKLPQADASTKAGKWEKSKFTGVELRGKTLAVLGLGKIGKEVARRARSFQMTVIAYDPFVNANYLKDVEVELVELDAALRRADVITLHLPSTPETDQLIGGKNLLKLKPAVLLVNCARGTLVNEAEVIAALKANQIGGAAFDVYPDEPNVNPELRALPNVVLTPHIAGSTHEAQEQVGFDIARQVTNYLQTGEVAGAVNFPSLAREEYARMKPYFDLGLKLGALACRTGAGVFEEIAIRYYGELAKGDIKLVTSHILTGVLRCICPGNLNLINAAAIAKERGIRVVETRSSRERGFHNLISVQLRNGEKLDWVEGSVLQPARQRIVSVDGIDIEAPLTGDLLVIRNQDTPGVIGAVGTILGQAQVNIGNFALGRNEKGEAIGIVNVDGAVRGETLEALRKVAGIRDVRYVELGA